MAFKIPYELKCSCNRTFQADIYEYVFVQYDPELKDMILSGEFNMVTCPSCEETFPIENRFLYRDEKNKLWIWVCKKEGISKRKRLEKELLEKNVQIKGHFLEHQEDYRKFLVFGRDELIELLLKEDKSLKKKEGKNLKENSALRLLTGDKENPGYLFLLGKTIRLSLPLSLPQDRFNDQSEEKWLKSYAQGINIHNRFSSFLPYHTKSRWKRTREKEPIKTMKDEFEDFAGFYAAYKIDKKRMKMEFPVRYEFFQSLKINTSRKIVTCKN